MNITTTLNDRKLLMRSMRNLDVGDFVKTENGSIGVKMGPNTVHFFTGRNTCTRVPLDHQYQIPTDVHITITL